MNDALRSYAFIQHETATIACACLDLACVDMQIGLPKQWYEVFDVDPEAIMDTRYVCVYVCLSCSQLLANMLLL